MLEVRDIAWLAGLIEGEGSFTDSGGSVMIQLQMTDGDVIKKAAVILGVKPRKPWVRKDGYKPVHSCYACGIKAIGWMMTLYTFLGERRQARVREILEKWKAANYTPRLERGKKAMATCHPSRPRRAGLLCKQCWMQRYRQRTGKNGTYYRKLKLALDKAAE